VYRILAGRAKPKGKKSRPDSILQELEAWHSQIWLPGKPKTGHSKKHRLAQKRLNRL
jgi:hypothetical protein